jgi:predicted O-methyltransferase YrrM
VKEPPTDTLTRLQAAGPAVETNAWSLGDEPLRRVLLAIDEGARTIVECGSGRSTVLIARRLAELGEGSVHSLEHDAGWADRTRELLAAEAVARAEVITAPLENGWYARSAVRLLPNSVDLLLIDGPPAGEPELRRSRHPTLDELGDRLRPGALIVLDDARRVGEAEAMELWHGRFSLEFERRPADDFATAQWPLYVPNSR